MLARGQMQAGELQGQRLSPARPAALPGLHLPQLQCKAGREPLILTLTRGHLQNTSKGLLVTLQRLEKKED